MGAGQSSDASAADVGAAIVDGPLDLPACDAGAEARRTAFGLAPIVASAFASDFAPDRHNRCLAAGEMPADRGKWRGVPGKYELPPGAALDEAAAAPLEPLRAGDEAAEAGEVARRPAKPVVKSTPPSGASRVLLHSCCAPCSGAMIEEMVEKQLDVTIFFYNPNIHPRREYEIRKEENKRYAARLEVPFVDCDYDAEQWFARMKGLEYDPERGTRCTACFDMRMEVTAHYAAAHGFPVFTTTNATSRWKDVDQVNASGIRAAVSHGEGRTEYWVYNWQTDEMTLRKYKISAAERFYKQEYCGCLHSLRDSNLFRKKEGIAPVKIGGTTAGLGTRYFEDPDLDAEEESQEVVDQFFADAERQFDDERLRELYEGRKKASMQSGGGGAGPPTVQLAQMNNW